MMIGIDLGTTNSTAFLYRGGRPEIIETRAGGRLLPSVVVYHEGEWVVGERAVDLYEKSRFRYANVKRVIGRPFNDGEASFYQTVEGKDGMALLVGPDSRNYAPEEISAMILAEIKATAEEKLGFEITGAVIGVPAYFDAIQVEATRRAGELAGFETVHTIAEPKAAAYAHDISDETRKHLAVFDMGGGTFDIALMAVRQGDYDTLHTDGSQTLGGVDFDRDAQRHAENLFRIKTGIELNDLDHPATRLKVLRSAEKAKRTLSQYQSAEIEAPNAAADEDGAWQHLHEPLTREQFEELTRSRINHALQITQRCLDNAPGGAMTVDEFDEVLLVGGMTRMPAVRDAVRDFFGIEPSASANAELIVGMGCAIEAAIKEGRIKNRSGEDKLRLPVLLETAQGTLMELIPSGSLYGFMEKVTLTSVVDNQSILHVGLYQGDSLILEENTLLGEAVIDLEPMEAGEPSVDLRVRVTDDGRIRAELDLEDGSVLPVEIGA